MTAEALKALLQTPLALLGLMILASLASAFKQMAVARRDGAATTAGEYFSSYWPETFITVGQNVGLFLVLLMTDQLNFASALGGGYAANSTADLWTKAGRSTALNVQAGFIRPAMLAVLCALALCLSALPGCSSTRAAYAEADTPQEYAYVLTEHYAALVHEAAELAELPGTPASEIVAMQKADAAAQPGLAQLQTALTAYQAVANPQTEADMQRATDNAVRLLADLVRSVQSARGKQP